MKNLFFVLFVFLLGGMVQVSAQSCSKSKAAGCCASKTASAEKAALKAAELDPTIEKKVCEKSGKVSFYRNTVDETGVSVSTQVMYDEGKAMFVNQSTEVSHEGEAKAKACSSAAKGKACCSKKDAKGCSKAKAENTSPVN
ncbi:MAG: hypothetical protein IPM48_12195 [Saprospiraceae bacterium]|nr:hypothetical protein [Saprospiraceae bacterium]